MRKITISDKSLFDKYLDGSLYSSYIGSDLLFSNIFLWFDAEFEIKNNSLIIKIDKNTFLPPLAYNEEEFLNAFLEIKKSKDAKIVGITKKMKNIIKQDILEDRNHYEYIYETEKLIKLEGHKLKSKRNRVNRFLKSYEASIVKMSRKDKDNVLDFYDVWVENKESSNEKLVIEKAMNYFDELNLFGDLFYIDNKLVGFSIAEKRNNITYILFEKADTAYDGIFQFVNQKFLERNVNTPLVNRQEDLGILGLRNSKMSYDPYLLLEKYIYE